MCVCNVTGASYMSMPKELGLPRNPDNAMIALFLGLQELKVGWKGFTPAENTRKWAPDMNIKQTILYGDLYKCHDRSLAFDFLFKHYRNDDSDSETVNDLHRVW